MTIGWDEPDQRSSSSYKWIAISEFQCFCEILVANCDQVFRNGSSGAIGIRLANGTSTPTVARFADTRSRAYSRKGQERGARGECPLCRAAARRLSLFIFVLAANLKLQFAARSENQ